MPFNKYTTIIDYSYTILDWILIELIDMSFFMSGE
jgi:hypothetical protein